MSIKVAIKQIIKQGSEQDNIPLQEACFMRHLNHCNIVSAFGVYETRKAVYIVMEHVDGGNLNEFVEETDAVRVLGERMTRKVIHDILSGLLYLHDRGIVHRDLKFENVLCEDNMLPCRVKIADFGLAGRVSDGLKSQVGSPRFVAPEVAHGVHYGAKVDCWSVGVMMYYLLRGRYPFRGRTKEEVLQRVKHQNVAIEGAEWVGVSKTGIALLKGLLQRDPEKRLRASEALRMTGFGRYE